MFSKTMTKPKKSSKFSRNAHSLNAILLVMGLWCIGIFASVSMLVPQRVYAEGNDSIPGGDVRNAAIRAVDIAKPAIVRMRTDVNGRLTVHFSTGDVTFPQQANGSYPVTALGTGTFISSQGDILTADHVVHPPKDQGIDTALYSEAAQDVADYMNQHAQTGTKQVSADDVAQQLKSGQLQSSTTYDTPTSYAYLSTDYVGTFTVSNLNDVPGYSMATVDKIKADSPFDQKDVAIVHVPIKDTPGVAIGNSDDVQQQDQLTVIGFPGNADVSQKPQDFLTSSISFVYVSSKKASDSGAPLIQIGGNINHGNSGGPALNSQGEIVGVVSFGLASGDSSSIDGTSFLQASSSALGLAQSINLDMTAGPFQKLWSQAFEDYGATTAGHWHRAAQEFTQLKQGYPHFQAVQPFLTYAQKQATTESVSSVTATPTQTQRSGTSSAPSVGRSVGLAPWPAWAIIAGAVLLLLVLAGGLFTVSVRRRGRRTRGNGAGSKDGSTMARPKPSEAPVAADQSLASSGTGQSTLSLKVWPCGHMNRPTARFCHVCGEPAPDK